MNFSPDSPDKGNLPRMALEVAAQNCVDLGLIATPLRAEPVKYVGIEPQ